MSFPTVNALTVGGFFRYSALFDVDPSARWIMKFGAKKPEMVLVFPPFNAVSHEVTRPRAVATG
jgi:hypothetical protein